METTGVLDPEGVHHEFVSGMHGRKLDFEAIPDGSDLFDEWADVVAQELRFRYAGEQIGRMVLLGVANGTNRLVVPVAERLDDGSIGLETRKISPKAVRPTESSIEDIHRIQPELAVVIEDAATQGTTAATCVVAARRLGIRRVEVINTWQRRPKLEKLLAIGAVYHSIIFEPLPTLEPEACAAAGYCAQGWDLIDHGGNQTILKHRSELTRSGEYHA